MNNNKKIIWITCTVSVLFHVALSPFVPTLSNLTLTIQNPNSKAIKLTLFNAPLSKPKDSSKNQEIPVLKDKALKQEKPISLKNDPKEQQKSPQLKAPSTSEKQKQDEKLPELGGDRHKGMLKEPKHISSSKQFLNTQSSPKETTKEQNLLNPPQHLTTAKEKKNTLLLTPNSNQPQKYDPDKTSLAKRDKTLKSTNRQANPLFDAINQANPIQNTSTMNFKELEALSDERLEQSRLGDPLSTFEQKQKKVYNKYLAIMKKQVIKHWKRPNSTEMLLTKVKLYLTLDGFIKDIYIEESSGHLAFDQEAIRAIKAVPQFHMPPNKAAAGYLTRLTMTLDNYSEN